MSIKEILTEILEWIKAPIIRASSGVASTYIAESGTHRISFGVATNGNRGLWDSESSSWLIDTDGTDAYIMGNKVADIVIETGTKSETGISWEYRKWASGICECWGYTGSYSMACTSAWGNLWYAPLKVINFPSGLFYSTPKTVQLTVWSNGGGCFCDMKTWGITAVEYYVWSAKNETRTGEVNIFAMGRWK